jgi:hypothetical protein
VTADAIWSHDLWSPFVITAPGSSTDWFRK